MDITTIKNLSDDAVAKMSEEELDKIEEFLDANLAFSFRLIRSAIQLEKDPTDDALEKYCKKTIRDIKNVYENHNDVFRGMFKESDEPTQKTFMSIVKDDVEVSTENIKELIKMTREKASFSLPKGVSYIEALENSYNYLVENVQSNKDVVALSIELYGEE